MNYTSSQYQALIQRLQRLHEHDIECTTDSLREIVGNELAEIRSGLAALRQALTATPHLASAVHPLELATERACDALRQMAFALQPPGTEDLGVVPALERSLAEFAGVSGVTAKMQTTGRMPPLTRIQRVTLHRVLEEALQNVSRHAHARNVEVHLTSARHSLTMQVRDDGAGMTDFDRQKSGALGLVALDERLAECGGSLRVVGTQGRGTLLEATVPTGRSTGKSTVDMGLAYPTQAHAEPAVAPQEAASRS